MYVMRNENKDGNAIILLALCDIPMFSLGYSMCSDIYFLVIFLTMGEDTPPGIIVSLVLGTVHMWYLKGDRNKIVDLIVRHFSASELLEARKELSTAVKATEPVTRRDSSLLLKPMHLNCWIKLESWIVRRNYQC